MIALKRAYEPVRPSDGKRFLVDRLWPRGIDKKKLQLEAWLKHVAPSNELRKTFCHDLSKWREFQRRYFVELDRHPEAWKPLLEASKTGDITLVYGARDTEHNNAIVLRDYLQKKTKRKQKVPA